MRDRTSWAQHVAGGSHYHAIDACGDWMAFGSRAGSVVVWNARLGVRQALQCRPMLLSVALMRGPEADGHMPPALAVVCMGETYVFQITPSHSYWRCISRTPISAPGEVHAGCAVHTAAAWPMLACVLSGGDASVSGARGPCVLLFSLRAHHPAMATEADEQEGPRCDSGVEPLALTASDAHTLHFEHAAFPRSHDVLPALVLSLAWVPGSEAWDKEWPGLTYWAGGAHRPPALLLSTVTHAGQRACFALRVQSGPRPDALDGRQYAWVGALLERPEGAVASPGAALPRAVVLPGASALSTLPPSHVVSAIAVDRVRSVVYLATRPATAAVDGKLDGPSGLSDARATQVVVADFALRAISSAPLRLPSSGAQPSGADAPVGAATARAAADPRNDVAEVTVACAGALSSGTLLLGTRAHGVVVLNARTLETVARLPPPRCAASEPPAGRTPAAPASVAFIRPVAWHASADHSSAKSNPKLGPLSASGSPPLRHTASGGATPHREHVAADARAPRPCRDVLALAWGDGRAQLLTPLLGGVVADTGALPAGPVSAVAPLRASSALCVALARVSAAGAAAAKASPLEPASPGAASVPVTSIAQLVAAARGARRAARALSPERGGHGRSEGSARVLAPGVAATLTSHASAGLALLWETPDTAARAEPIGALFLASDCVPHWVPWRLATSVLSSPASPAPGERPDAPVEAPGASRPRIGDPHPITGRQRLSCLAVHPRRRPVFALGTPAGLVVECEASLAAPQGASGAVALRCLGVRSLPAGAQASACVDALEYSADAAYLLVSEASRVHVLGCFGALRVVASHAVEPRVFVTRALWWAPPTGRGGAAAASHGQPSRRALLLAASLPTRATHGATDLIQAEPTLAALRFATAAGDGAAGDGEPLGGADSELVLRDPVFDAGAHPGPDCLVVLTRCTRRGTGAALLEWLTRREVAWVPIARHMSAARPHAPVERASEIPPVTSAPEAMVPSTGGDAPGPDPRSRAALRAAAPTGTKRATARRARRRKVHDAAVEVGAAATVAEVGRAASRTADASASALQDALVRGRLAVDGSGLFVAVALQWAPAVPGGVSSWEVRVYQLLTGALEPGARLFGLPEVTGMAWQPPGVADARAALPAAAGHCPLVVACADGSLRFCQPSTAVARAAARLWAPLARDALDRARLDPLGADGERGSVLEAEERDGGESLPGVPSARKTEGPRDWTGVVRLARPLPFAERERGPGPTHDGEPCDAAALERAARDAERALREWWAGCVASTVRRHALMRAPTSDGL